MGYYIYLFYTTTYYRYYLSPRPVAGTAAAGWLAAQPGKWPSPLPRTWFYLQGSASSADPKSQHHCEDLIVSEFATSCSLRGRMQKMRYILELRANHAICLAFWHGRVAKVRYILNFGGPGAPGEPNAGSRTFSGVFGGVRGIRGDPPPPSPSEKEPRTSHAGEPRWGRRISYIRF